jgi:hypothetical protein
VFLLIRYALACLALVASLTATASDLALGPISIQRLVVEQMFTQRGRWYLVDNGPCYAYLERPKTRLRDGRLILDAHMSGRIGIQMGDSCAGSQISTNLTLSAKPVAKGPSLSLDDIRVDRIEDSASRDVLDVIRQIAPQALPKSFSLDVLTFLQSKSVGAAGFPVTVTQFRILNAQTRPDAVIISFDISLTAP